jgi:anti-sigma factor RsiW
MECPLKERRKTDLLLDSCAGRLDPQPASELAMHIASCPACEEWIRGHKQVWQALDVFEAEPVSAGFDDKLFERIARDEDRKPWWSVFRPRRFAFGRPAAASVLSLALASLLVLAALLIERPRPPAVSPAGAARVEAIDADRIEKALDDVEMLRELSVTGTPDPRSM